MRQAQLGTCVRRKCIIDLAHEQDAKVQGWQLSTNILNFVSPSSCSFQQGEDLLILETELDSQHWNSWVDGCRAQHQTYGLCDKSMLDLYSIHFHERKLFLHLLNCTLGPGAFNCWHNSRVTRLLGYLNNSSCVPWNARSRWARHRGIWSRTRQATAITKSGA